MENTPSYAYTAEIARNLMRVHYQGQVSIPDVRAVAEWVKQTLPQMRQGFTLLVDLTGLESMELECARDIALIMDACNAAGIGTVARIVPDPRKDIGLNILSIIHYRRGVHVLTYENLAEAERLMRL